MFVLYHQTHFSHITGAAVYFSQAEYDQALH